MTLAPALTPVKAEPATVKGWCPGALRPMETGDGLVVRLRITGGVVEAPLAHAVADLSRSFGNRQIDLSQRSNLQIRGVTDARLGELLDRIATLGILDEDPATEAIRNIIANPLAGRDPTAPVDGPALVAALEERLRTAVPLRALPGKFGFIVDDGSRLSLAEAAADIRFRGIATPKGPRLEVELGSTDPAHTVTLGTVAPDTIADVAEALALTFLALRPKTDGDPRRIAAVVARFGAEPFVEAIADRLTPAAATPDRRRRTLHGTMPFGASHQVVIAAGAPFGRLTDEQIDALASVAIEFGEAELRIAPWRAILIPGVADLQSGEALAHLEAAGLIVDPADPLLSVVACPGRPECRSASVDSRGDARVLAAVARRLVGEGLALHVSACEKGCAHPGEMRATLVGHDGTYDLVVDGRAGDEPVARGLGQRMARRTLDALARGLPLPVGHEEEEQLNDI